MIAELQRHVTISCEGACTPTAVSLKEKTIRISDPDTKALRDSTLSPRVIHAAIRNHVFVKFVSFQKGEKEFEEAIYCCETCFVERRFGLYYSGEVRPERSNGLH